MLTDNKKPKLTFFQSSYDDGLPEFLLAHKDEHVDCLSLFFDVTVIRHDCDYDQICDIYQPEITLFESGVNLLTCRRPKIRNVRSNQKIPKLGLLNADAWCETRSGSLSEMDQWGIETMFSISLTAAEHMPAVANRLFSWPNFVNPVVYHDYNEAKLIPVLLSGATAAQYPWRRRVYKLIAERYPSLWCPHRGYLSQSSAGQVLSGTKYARTISASEVAPVCGTVAKEVVRKHFEIPACNTCLITERARNLEDAGFIDMTNCVFADEHDILDKLDFLFNQPDRLRQITSAGYQLVHTQHTKQQRNQILQWFNLNRNLIDDEKIVQTNAFAPLRVVGKPSQQPLSIRTETGTHLKLLREGDELLWAGRFEAAESKYQRCLSYMYKLPEARFKIALCKLYQGRASEANSRIFELIQYCISEYQAVDPDPVEWAYYILSLLGMGKRSDAYVFALEFPWLRHPELDRVRQFVSILSGKVKSSDSMPDSVAADRPSIHLLPERSMGAWGYEIRKIMSACGKSSLSLAAGNISLKNEDTGGERSHLAPTVTSRGRNQKPALRQESRSSSTSPKIFSQSLLEKKFLLYKFQRKLRKVNGKLTTALYKIGGKLLPTSAMRGADQSFTGTIEELIRDLELKTILIIGSRTTEEIAAAVLKGSIGNTGKTLVCCLSDVPHKSSFSHKKAINKDYIKWYTVSTQNLSEEFVVSLQKKFDDIKRENCVESFDAIVVNWHEMDHRNIAGTMLGDEFCNAKLVAFSDLQSEFHREIYTQVISQNSFEILEETTSKGSYVLLKKKSIKKNRQRNDSFFLTFRRS